MRIALVCSRRVRLPRVRPRLLAESKPNRMLKTTANLSQLERTGRFVRSIREHNRHHNQHIHHANIHQILKHMRRQVHDQRAQLYYPSWRLLLLLHDRAVIAKADPDNLLSIAYLARF